MAQITVAHTAKVLPQADFEKLLIEADLEIEALRAFVLRGPEEGIAWLHATINRASWSSRPAWHWWPLYGAMALMNAREGRVAAAESWLSAVPLPGPLELLVRATIASAAGNWKEAGTLAAAVAAVSGVAHRWYLMAGSIQAGIPNTPDVEGSLFLQSEDWDYVLGVVAFAPAATRALMIPLLDPEHAVMPGITLEERPEPDPAVRLTPRQLQVLRGLADGKSMSEIAASLYVGVETVRTASKHVYRRLGVHDRQSAVDVARAQGLL